MRALMMSGHVRVIERRWPSFMRYAVTGIGYTGERDPATVPTSWNFQKPRKPAGCRLLNIAAPGTKKPLD